MNRSASRHHRHLPRKSAVALLTLGIVTALATPAFAHHPDVTGEVVCATDGQQVVTWTVTNSESNDRTMTLDQVAVSAGTVSPLSIGTAFPPKPGAGSTQTSTTELPGTQTGEVTLTVRGDWDKGGPQDVERSVSVTLPGTCTETVTTTTTTPTTTTTTESIIVAAEPTTTTTAAPVTTTTTLPTEVLGVVLAAPAAVTPVAELPRTGAPMGATVLLGAVALTLGLIVSRLGREKTAS